MADTDAQSRIGVLGATSLVGACLLPLLTKSGWRVIAFSRRPVEPATEEVVWRQITSGFPTSLTHPLPIRRDLPVVGAKSHVAPAVTEGNISYWISVAPIWILPDYFDLFSAHGARRVVALSSTSRFTKVGSSDPEEQVIATRIADAELRMQKWAETHGVEWVILRPTLIYGLGGDKNIAEIARFIRHFGFFPLFGNASGLRQPIHAADVADACLAATQVPCAANRAYNISGGETLAYQDMVARIFTAVGRRPRLLMVPLWAFSLAVSVFRHWPRYRHWSVAMAARMNQDLVFDHAESARDLGFAPRTFVLAIEDLPI